MAVVVFVARLLKPQRRCFLVASFPRGQRPPSEALPANSREAAPAKFARPCPPSPLWPRGIARRVLRGLAFASMAYHLVNFMKHRLELVAKVLETASEDYAKRMIQQTVECFQIKFRCYKPSFQEVQALQEQLEATDVLPEATKVEMLNILDHAEVAPPATADQAGGRGGTQTCSHFFNYLTQADWDALAHPGVATANKIAVLSHRVSSIGFLWPSEKGFTLILATGLAGQGGLTRPEIEAAQGEAGLTLVRDLKAQIDMEMKLREGYSRPLPAGRLQVYPETPDRLPEELSNVAA